MKKISSLIISILLLFISGCNDSSSINEPGLNATSNSYVFVAGEGDFYTSNSGSISYIDEYGNVNILEEIGSTVHSVEVHEDILLVSVNGDQKILVYNISDLGLEFKMEILTDGQSPRDIIVISDRAYFTTWNPDWYIYPAISGYIKVLDLNTFEILESIEVGIMPEGMLYKDGYLWVANSGESSVSKINTASNIVEESLNVGSGPQFLTELNDDIYIARTFYNDDYTEIFYGTSKINGNSIMEATHNFSAGGACGGSVMTFNNKVYRSFDGGLVRMVDNLDLDLTSKIGNYDQSQVYHVEIINGNIWFTLTDYSTMNMVKIIDSNGNELASYDVGVNPGDLAFWKKSE